MLSAQQLSILQELADGDDHPVNRHKHRALTNLLNDGYIEEVGDGIWCITIEGREAHAAAMAATAEPKPPRIPKRKGITIQPAAPQPRFNIAPLPPKPAEDFYDPKPPAANNTPSPHGEGAGGEVSSHIVPQDTPAFAYLSMGDKASPLPASGEGFIVGLDHAFDVHIAQPDRSILQLEVLRGINRD